MATLQSNFSLLFLIGLTILFSNCSPPKPVEQTYGDVDKTAIAKDTTMEADMDLSYEYHKTLVQNDSIVYDFLAYDKPAYGDGKKWESKFHLIRRAAYAQDTIVKGTRSDAVKNIWLCDLDQNGRPEIMFYETSKSGINRNVEDKFYAYETDGRSQAHAIIANFIKAHQGADTFFVYQKYLIRSFPAFKRDSIAGAIWQYYTLRHGSLVFEKEARGL